MYTVQAINQAAGLSGYGRESNAGRRMSRAIKKPLPIGTRTAMRGKLGQLDTGTAIPTSVDTTATTIDPNSITVDTSTLSADVSALNSAYLNNTTSLTPVITGNASVSTAVGSPVQVAVPPTTSGNPFSDILNAITGAAQTATEVYTAADLIRVNNQRAAQGLPPINQYGVVAPRTTSAGLSLATSPLVIYAVVGVALFALLSKRRSS